ncbi:PREDICTED: F-box protein At5g07610-like [Fragaria vesca subsp. vesca]|uniref:F-box protein At5g07610-like isoform X1 n=1 Tax=Fragaria vesca subsp. vesca TaxID=101020 RepID=UPI0002C35DEB|nr:PREDICTED: F-box protein At5g07610-like isoform X1 [Fragaria vesca subsp. vesca]XP_004304002.2 PREDICTED: F-box protein At5g07610-like isoform X1 [Fragaria vesca subsp. vesca]XP_011467712.1 PREDICTED: F-box protein At5g07610-like isoform X1 [Fragaria vesca subsp. vesca]XP_011467713.1 PREDICTED: F-box protein At5g07610-like isoform X1 [Fragaria vesca subsp. vesca]XP_011467714.1 PREDICTED: F-box protein At5g07610-like isoform X1 [Fragaria vesca subsp. vesca]
MAQRLYPKRCSSTSAETVANIEELLTEILLLLPAKPLVRFKCVSKHWLSLISNPNFCHRHTLQYPNFSISAVFSDSCEDFSFIPFPPHHDPSGIYHGYGHNHSSPRWYPLDVIANQYGCIRIINSCNGLFLCLPIVATSISRSPYFVLNPTTSKFLTLAIPPISDGQQVENHILGCSLAFDPSKSPHYKVICLETTTGSDYQVQIYSSETRSWRLVSSSFKIQDHTIHICYEKGVYFNGAVHWVGLYCEMSYLHIDEERVEFVQSPPHCREKNPERREYRYFKETSGGHLHLIDIYWPTQAGYGFEVLEMGRDYSGWFVKYNVDLRSCPPSRQFVVLFLDRDENEEGDGSSLWLHYPGQVVSCNLTSNTFNFFELTTDHCLLVESDNFPFKETLTCV